MTILGVIGSRTFLDGARLFRTIDHINPSLIISGGAIGADSLAEDYADICGVPKRIHRPDFTRPGAYHRRDRLIAEESQKLIAFWDGRSPGTRYTINYALFIGRPVQIERF